MALILVVDDLAANRELLRAYLEPGGHEVVEAETGEAAIEHAARVQPDLVLLDVMMPGINGFETAARLKKQSGGRFLPILMITALSDPSSRLLALRVGGDEFLSKPVDRSELITRCNNLLRIRDQETQLADRHRQLLELQRFRDEMATLIVHDLKNPLSAVVTNLEYILGEPLLRDDMRDAAEDARAGLYRALRLLANLLDVAKLEADRMALKRSSVSMRALVDPVLEQRRRLLAARSIRLESTLTDDELAVDADLITRVIENILDNALRYTPEGGVVSVEGRASGRGCELRIGNSGPAVPPEARVRIFEKFGQAEGARRMNLGLGLYFCRLVVEAHGGRLSLEDTADLPTLFSIALPRPS
jgi:two-component system, sensor histidine kinase and response regulator